MQALIGCPPRDVFALEYGGRVLSGGVKTVLLGTILVVFVGSWEILGMSTRCEEYVQSAAFCFCSTAVTLDVCLSVQ